MICVLNVPKLYAFPLRLNIYKILLDLLYFAEDFVQNIQDGTKK